jgi:hypothetical protein
MEPQGEVSGEIMRRSGMTSIDDRDGIPDCARICARRRADVADLDVEEWPPEVGTGTHECEREDP